MAPEPLARISRRAGGPRRPWLAAVLSLALLCAGACQKSDKMLFESAERLWLSDEHQEAADKLKLLVSEYPDSSRVSSALFRLGEIYYLNLEDPVKALDYFIKVTEREGKTDLNLKTHKYIAEIYERSLRNYDLAILQYQRILNEFRDIVKADEYRLSIGKAYFKKSDCGQAIIEYQTLLDEFPESGLALDARYQIANCRIIRGEPAKAIELYKSALADYPGSRYEYDIRLGIGMGYEELDQLSKALVTYEEMNKDFPDRKLIEKKIISINKRINKRKR